MAAQTSTGRQKLLKKLQAADIDIPDLNHIFKQWPYPITDTESVQQRLEELRKEVDTRLNDLFASGAAKSLHALIDADFALFTVSWWPDADLESQRTLAFLVIWLFIWDDEVDEPSGAVADDFDAAERYRADTETFVKHSLGLTDAVKHNIHGIQPGPIVQSFETIGAHLRTAYNVPQRERFFTEIAFFMRMSRLEQQTRLAGHIPSLDEYWNFRLGTSAVYIGVAAGELSTRTKLPEWIMASAAMRALWTETNVIISLTNDLLSLKEIRNGCVDSVVPLACAAGMSVEEAIKDAVKQIGETVGRFEEAVEGLEREGGEWLYWVRRFVRVCRTNCTGNLVWSLQTTRYGMNEKLESKDSAEV